MHEEKKENDGAVRVALRRRAFKTGRMRVPERMREDRSNELYKQKRRSHCNRIPMTVRCARVCIAARANERTSERGYSYDAYSRQAGMRVSRDTIVSLIACTAERPDCVHAV